MLGHPRRLGPGLGRLRRRQQRQALVERRLADLVATQQLARAIRRARAHAGEEGLVVRRLRSLTVGSALGVAPNCRARPTGEGPATR